jgi:predicted nucleic acid-binding protein
MSVRVFVDTNVLVYARDASEPDKQARAAEWMAALWERRAGRLSFQVLQEFYITVTAKLSPGLDQEAARRDVRALGAWQPLAVNSRVLEGAWALQDRCRLPWWDALIAAAAQLLECRYLLSEAFQEGLSLGSLTVIQPFQQRPGELSW